MNIQSSVFFTGSMKLLEDAGLAIALISPLLGGVMGAYCFFRKTHADEMDYKKWSDRLKTVLASGVGGALAGTLMKVVGSYYGIN